MKVFLDDRRPAPPGWTLVRWPADVIKLLQTCEDVTHISLDNDLGDETEMRTGYDVLVWLEESVALRGFVPPHITIHSSNASARVRMELAVKNIAKLFEEREAAKALKIFKPWEETWYLTNEEHWPNAVKIVTPGNDVFFGYGHCSEDISEVPDLARARLAVLAPEMVRWLITMETGGSVDPTDIAMASCCAGCGARMEMEEPNPVPRSYFEAMPNRR